MPALDSAAVCSGSTPGTRKQNTLEEIIMEEKVLHFSTAKAIRAQSEYCEKHHVEMVAPGLASNGCCPYCHNPIYIVGGVSIEEAESTLVSGCPYCHYSFVK